MRDAIAGLGLDALVITHLPNVRYLTNFAGTTAMLVLAREGLWFITDGRYVTEVGSLLSSPGGPSATTLVRVERTYEEALLGVLRASGVRRVGFEAASLTVKRLSWLEAAFGPAAGPAALTPAYRGLLVPTERVIERLRIRKDAHELGLLKEAACRLSRVALQVLEELRSGPSEREVARHIDDLLLAAGFERPAFDTIVASGPQSALPHARPCDRAIARGELVLLDFGGVSDGYCVDLTRTVALGTAPHEADRLHSAVLEAQRAAIQAVRPGVPASRVDGAARGILEAAGLAEAFPHGTGHGLGLEVHEEPRISRRHEPTAEQQAGRVPPPPIDEELAPGMVFTIEPGAYVPGVGGVRIEDDIVVTDEGCEVLTDVPRGLTL